MNIWYAQKNLQAISSGWTMIKFVLADTLAAVTTTSAKESFIVDCIVCSSEGIVVMLCSAMGCNGNGVAMQSFSDEDYELNSLRAIQFLI